MARDRTAALLDNVQDQISYNHTRGMLRWRAERKTGSTKWKMRSTITNLEMEIRHISERHRYSEADKQMETGTAD